MVSTTFTILLLVSAFCNQLRSGHGQGLNGIGGALAAGQALNGAGPAGGVVDSVPIRKCEAPVDHSCDDQSFDEIAGKIAGGGLMSGASKGVLGSAAGGALGNGGLPIGRRRRGLFGGKLGAVPQPPPPNPIGPAPGAANSVGGAGNALNSINAVPGTSFFKDPNGLGPSAIQGKLHKCDEKTKPGGQFDQIKDQLSSGNFQSLTSPQALNAGDQCKKLMDNDRKQCQMLKRQCCAFLNGGVKDPSQLSCVFKDIITTSSQIQATNSACDTAQKLVSNPSDAGNTLQGGAKGVGTGLVAGAAGEKILGR